MTNRQGAIPKARTVKTAEAPKKPEAPPKPAAPEPLYREWTFQSHHPGLHQVLIPSRKDNMGNLLEEQFEANFGGDSGRDGVWRIRDDFQLQRADGAVYSGGELVEIMRAKMEMKPIADRNIVELTRNKKEGDPVYEPVEPEAQPSERA